jgi:hypothetical protein
MTEDEARVGLCFTCRHSQRVPSRTSVYRLCRLAAVDPRFDKYPRLPVLRCAGYDPEEPATPGDEFGE